MYKKLTVLVMMGVFVLPIALHAHDENDNRRSNRRLKQIESSGVMNKFGSNEQVGFTIKIKKKKGTFGVTGFNTNVGGSDPVQDYQGFNGQAKLDCIDSRKPVKEDGDLVYELIVSGRLGPASFKLPAGGVVAIPDERFYGRLQITVNGETGETLKVHRSSWPAESEACLFSQFGSVRGVPEIFVLPNNFPLDQDGIADLLPEFADCHERIENFNGKFITCKDLKKKDIAELEDDFGLTLDRGFDTTQGYGLDATRLQDDSGTDSDDD